MSDEIYKILKKEMEGLQNNMKLKFEDNFNNKRNNWTLKEFDDRNTAYLVFVSSFESQYGNMFENISKEIAKLSFGKENVKFTFKGFDVTDEEYKKYTEKWSKSVKGYAKKQYIVSKVGSENNSEIIKFRDNISTSYQQLLTNYIDDNIKQEVDLSKLNKQTSSKLTQEILPNLIERINYSDKEIFKKEVDLLYFDEDKNEYNLFEIKAGGNLDSGKGPSTIANMLKKYASLGKTNTHLYFATIYNKDGKGKKWTGNITSTLDKNMILIGKDFWNKILPNETSFEEFKEIYYNLFNELNFNEFLNNLIEDYYNPKTRQLSFDDF